MKLNHFKRVNSKPDDKMKLTLGSAVRNGEFLRLSRWPLADGEGRGRDTITESWEGSTQEIVI